MSSKLSDNMLEQTLTYWRERTGREVSIEDAREMVENVSGFFRLLNEWHENALENGDTAACPD